MTSPKPRATRARKTAAEPATEAPAPGGAPWVDDNNRAEEPAEPQRGPEPERKPDDDERIGWPVPIGTELIGYDDGAQYKCKDGWITERVL